MTENKIEKLTPSNSDTASTTGEGVSIAKTLLIFDFDDTLFSTKYFDSFSLPYKDIFDFKVSLEQLNPCLFKEIKELEKNLLELFSQVHVQGPPPVIVSNADMRWIKNCLTHFLEEFNDFIEENDIKIYSAKNIFSNEKNTDFKKESTFWKVQCFEKVVNDVFIEEKKNYENEGESNLELNVISIGDGEDEKKAVFNLTKNKNKFPYFQNIRSKFIRMIDSPSAASIILQLQYLLENMNKIIESNKTIYTMNIDIVNGSTQVRCVPKKKKDKINKIKMISNSYEKKNLNLIDDKNDFFYIKNELENDFDNFDEEENLARKCLFLGKKTFLCFDLKKHLNQQQHYQKDLSFFLDYFHSLFFLLLHFLQIYSPFLYYYFV